MSSFFVAHVPLYQRPVTNWITYPDEIPPPPPTHIGVYIFLRKLLDFFAFVQDITRANGYEVIVLNAFLRS